MKENTVKHGEHGTEKRESNKINMETKFKKFDSLKEENQCGERKKKCLKIYLKKNFPK